MSKTSSPKLRVVYRCNDCGAQAAKWVGRCTSCNSWNSIFEDVEEDVSSVVAAANEITAVMKAAAADAVQAIAIADVDISLVEPWSTGIGELDRVLGGGLVPGSVTLIGGEPGIGKSTLTLQVVAGLVKQSRTCLLVCGEESMQQVKMRASRIGALSERFWLISETDVPSILVAADKVRPDVMIIDSIQTMIDPQIGSMAGSVAQVRGVTNSLVHLAKSHGIAVVLVGHVTKEGALAGPRVLEHAVDTVLSFEGDRHHGLRMLRAMKHRFGPTGELGLFEMTETGLAEVGDPSGLFLADRRIGSSGSVVVPVIDGSRPLLVEVQALVCKSAAEIPRRAAQGIDTSRLAMLLAVVGSRTPFKMHACDVYVSVAGGVRAFEPAVDLGVTLALISALTNVALPTDFVVCGEVGLGGEVRQVAHVGRRLAEASRLGFGTALVPPGTTKGPKGMRLTTVGLLHDALAACGLAGQTPSFEAKSGG